MEIGIFGHEGKEKTGRAMYALSREFASDLGGLADIAFPDFFDLVRACPYLSDDERFPRRVVEVLARPRYLLDRGVFPRMDCKKKAILVGAWAQRRGLPYRFIAVSHVPTKQIHHVFPQIDFGRGWVNVDATMPENRIGQSQPATYAEELAP